MRKILMAVAVALLPGVGGACTWLDPFEMNQIAGAYLVLVGEVTGYQDLGTPHGTALVTLQVEQARKVGAKGGRLAVSTLVPDVRPDLPSIVQPYCEEVWMQPATPGTLAAAQEVLE